MAEANPILENNTSTLEQEGLDAMVASRESAEENELQKD